MRESGYAVASAFAVLVVLIPIFDNLFASEIYIFAKKNRLSPIELPPEDYEPLTGVESTIYRLKASICSAFGI